MATPKVTICPPRSAKGITTEPAFGLRRTHPVSATYLAPDEFSTPGIAFEDFSRMRTQQRKTTGSRRKPTPEWVVNDQKLQEVITRYVEVRAGFPFAQSGTREERIARAEARLTARASSSWRVLTKLNAEYRNAETTPERKAELVPLIRGLDSARIVDRHPAAVAAGCVWLYYRSAQDSVGVAAELGIKPPAVRQLLFRLDSVARGLTAAGSVRRRRRCTVCRKDVTSVSSKKCEACREAESLRFQQKAEALRAAVALAAQASEPQPAPEKPTQATLTRPSPRLCSVCGGPIPKRNGKTCGSTECKRMHRRRAAAAKRASRTPVCAFCGPVCREVAKHLPVPVIDMKERFGTTSEEARDSGFGNKSFESYLRVAEITGVAPMNFERWSQLQ